MLKLKTSLLVLALTSVFPTAPIFTKAAHANASNLVCEYPFKKIATYSNAIKCKTAGEGFRNRQAAGANANFVAANYTCNAHAGQPTIRTWKKGQRWAYRVTFICALIT